MFDGARDARNARWMPAQSEPRSAAPARIASPSRGAGAHERTRRMRAPLHDVVPSPVAAPLAAFDPARLGRSPTRSPRPLVLGFGERFPPPSGWFGIRGRPADARGVTRDVPAPDLRRRG